LHAFTRLIVRNRVIPSFLLILHLTDGMPALWTLIAVPNKYSIRVWAVKVFITSNWLPRCEPSGMGPASDVMPGQIVGAAWWLMTPVA
jgi:hypothetical protein